MALQRRDFLQGAAATFGFSADSAWGHGAPNEDVHVDWPDFLSHHDMIWDRFPQDWDEGPFLGDGMSGLIIYQDAATKALRFDLGRCDVQDHRSDLKSGAGFRSSRLPIGHFLLYPAGKVLKVALRLDLWRAETRGEIVTELGRIGLRAFVHASDGVIVLETTTEGNETDFRLEFVGEQANSPRQTYAMTVPGEQKRGDPDYAPNPSGVVSSQGPTSIYWQPLLVGGGTATVWQEAREGRTRRLLVSISHSFPHDGAKSEAAGVLRRAWVKPRDSFDARHRAWWAAFYPESFVSFTDTQWESFYWIQMYKLASATRKDRALIDDQGPWLELTPWPYATWNLNVQLTYSPVYAANRLELGESLVRALDAHRQTLVENVAPQYRFDSAGIGRATGDELAARVGVPGKLKDAWGDGVDTPPEVGLLTWTLHNVWRQYRFTMNRSVLRDSVVPPLRGAINYYRHFLRLGTDGRYHLPPTFSPEYGVAPDLNFDLSLIRWGCRTLLEANIILDLNDPLAPAWRDILTRLVDYPQDNTGYMIGGGTPYAFSHRHYSHLLMIYPLYLVNVDQPGARELIKTSLDYWWSKPEKLQGYSCTGAASISASLGLGDDALMYLRRLQSGFLRPNTLYRESGPVIETPLSAATSIHDMMLQSWGGTLRIFPAAPKAWPDIVFDNLRGEGAFLIGAERSGGVTRWISIRSLAGQPLRLMCDVPDPVASLDGQPLALQRNADGKMTVELREGQILIVAPRGTPLQRRVRPVKAQPKASNTYGLNANSPPYPPLGTSYHP